MSISGYRTFPGATLGGHHWFRGTVSSAGDTDADGYGDVLVSDPQLAIGGMDQVGRTHVFLGSASGLSATPMRTIDGSDGMNWYFGLYTGCVGDLDRNGYDDLLISAPSVS